MPAEEYHANYRLNVSSMKLFWQSPYHYKKRKELSKSSPAMFNGSALHLRILEPDEYKKVVGIHPLKLTNKGVPYKVQPTTPQINQNGSMFFSAKDLDLIEKSAKNILDDSLISVLLPDAKKEVTIFWTDRLGIDCKARFDFINEKHLIIGDLKTTQDASYEGFRKSIENFKYHWQAAHYEDGALAAFHMPFTFVFFCIEGEPIHRMAKYRCISVDLEKARSQIEWVKQEFKKCLSTNEWPCYPDEIVDMELRPWA